MGGQGISVASGQFIQATESGLTSVSSFGVSSFMSGLGDLAKSMGSGGTGSDSGGASDMRGKNPTDPTANAA